jgi:hypothetical protein
MRPLKHKIISWALAFATGVTSTFVGQSCLRPAQIETVSPSQPAAPQLASPTGEIRAQPEALPFDSPPTEPWQNVSLKFSNYFLREKAEGFYESEANYPQLTVLTTAAARRFNRYIEDLIRNRLQKARVQGKEIIRELQQKGEADQMVGGLTTTYEILFASPKVISVRFTHSYQSTFHPIADFESINYDLEAGQPLQLTDIFKPKAGYLPALSKLSRLKLLELFEYLDADSWMKRGTAPLAKSFAAWNIAAEGIVISFGDYQIGPYAMGTSSITIPFADLEKLLRRRDLLSSAAER